MSETGRGGAPTASRKARRKQAVVARRGRKQKAAKQTAPVQRPAEKAPAEERPAEERQVRSLDKLRATANHLHKEKKLAEAVAAYEAYLLRRPQDARVWSNLGVALRKLKHFEASEACYRRALEISPGAADYLGNLGNVLKDLDRLDESLEAHRRAVAQLPDNLDLRFNYGLALRESGHFEAALKEFDVCVQQAPDVAKYHWDRALALLHVGRMAEGWESYRWRWQIGELPLPPYETLEWQGEDLSGKTILLFPEQGFGDTILATRFIPLLKARGATVILECKPPLRRLFSGLDGVDRMIEPKSLMNGFDYHCSLMSLPGLLGADPQNLPPLPRLHIPQAARDKMRPFLRLAGDRFKVGFVWSGSVTFKNNRKRSVPAERFLQLAKVPGVQLFSLQKGPREEDLKELGVGPLVIDIGKRVDDFAETAAVIDELDLVVMTDSSVAHLTGCLRKPLWNLLCYVSYWVYGQSGDTTPWYPSMRIVRQPRAGDWDSVFDRVCRNLAKAVEAKKAGRWPKYVE